MKIRSIRGKYATHFAHLYDSDACPIKTNQQYTQEEIRNIQYNNVKESERHKYVKELIFSSLSSDPKFSDIKKESPVKDKEERKKPRRPDVLANINEQQFVFEIQLWTTWLKVLIARDQHYQRNQIFIGWIFDHFDSNELNTLGYDVSVPYTYFCILIRSLHVNKHTLSFHLSHNMTYASVTWWSFSLC